MGSPRNMTVPVMPISLEAVRQKVLETVQLTERETKIFLERYLPQIGDVSTWPGLVDSICSRVGKHSAYLHDFKDLDALLDKVKNDRLIIQNIEYSSLRRMTERARVFEYLAFSLRDNLNTAYEKYMKKYCKSFIGEIPHGMDILCVREHENKISFWDNQVRDRLELLDAILDEIHRHSSPFMKYVHHYDKVVQYMEEACKMMNSACEPIRKWVAADVLYARKVQHEINLLHKRQMELVDSTKQDEYENDRLCVQLKRKTYDTQTIERNLNEARAVIGLLKSKESELLHQRTKVRLILNQKKQELVKIRSKVKNRKENTPSIFAYLTGACEILREDIRSYEFKLDSLQLQINCLKQEQLVAERRVDNIVQELETSFKLHEENVARLKKQVDAVNKVKGNIEHIYRKIKTLKRIREIKMNGNTIKKIYHSDYQLSPLNPRRGVVDQQVFPGTRASFTMSKYNSHSKKPAQVQTISRSLESWRPPGGKPLNYADRYQQHVQDLKSQSLAFLSHR